MKLAYTRAIIDAIHAGDLHHVPTRTDPIFGMQVVTRCPNVPSAILDPKQAWADPAAYESSARKLAALFEENYAQFQAGGVIKGSFDG